MKARNLSLVLGLFALCAFFALRVPGFQFLSSRNLSLLLIDFSITATLAVGMLLVILPGHIDLSAGSGVGLTGGIAAVLLQQPAGVGAPAQWLLDLPSRFGFSLTYDVREPCRAYFAVHPTLHVVSSLATALFVALVLWRAMGTLIVRERIPAFIITLGGLLVFKGLFWLVIENHTIPVTVGGQSNLYALLTTYYLPADVGLCVAAALVFVIVVARLRTRSARRAHELPVEDGELTFLKLFITAQVIFLFVLITNQFRGLPLPALILGVVAFGVYVLTQHMPFGRYLYAIGGNEEAAVISGIRVHRVTVRAFTLMGAIVALTGFMQTAYGGSATTTVGDLMELDAVAACVIGGVSLRGGRGTVLGVLFGALIMACLINGMTLMAVSPEHKFIARGAVLILAVWMDVRLAGSR